MVPGKLRSRGKEKFDRSMWSNFFLWNTFSPVIEVEILLNYCLPGVISMCSLHLTQLIFNFVVLKINSLKHFFLYYPLLWLTNHILACTCFPSCFHLFPSSKSSCDMRALLIFPQNSGAQTFLCSTVRWPDDCPFVSQYLVLYEQASYPSHWCFIYSCSPLPHHHYHSSNLFLKPLFSQPHLFLFHLSDSTFKKGTWEKIQILCFTGGIAGLVRMNLKQESKTSWNANDVMVCINTVQHWEQIA